MQAKGGLTFNGGTNGAGGDKLQIMNPGALAVVDTPSATVPSGGVIAIGTTVVNYAGLEPILVSNALSFTLVTPNGADLILIDTPVSGQARISGSSGGVTFESVTVSGIPTVTLDLARNHAGAVGDIVTTKSAVPLAVPGTKFVVLAATGSSGDVLNVDTGGKDLVLDRDHLTVTGSTPALLTGIDRINLTGAGKVTVIGDSNDNALVVVASTPTAGSLRLDAGPLVVFDIIQRLNYLARGGSDRLSITNPAGTIFAPLAGIAYDGGGQVGDALELLGGGSASFTETYAVGPGTGDGLIQFSGPVSLSLVFAGLAPVTDTVAVGTLSVIATDAPNTIVMDDGASGTDGRLRISVDEFEPINFSAKAALVLKGGGGNDDIKINFTEAATGLAALTVEAGAGDDFVTLAAGVPIAATVLGGAGEDSIYGNDRNNILSGEAGRDFILAGAGNDEIHGGADNDILRAGAGTDKLFGDDGNDVLQAGAGDDTLLGGAGDDFLQGDEGIDRLEGGAGNDELFGGQGADVLSGEAGEDFLSGGDGNDEIHGGTENDSLTGDAGDDQLFGEDGEDLIHGNFGADILHGANGDDALFGDAGHDQLFGESGNDKLDGGEDNDQLSGDEGDDYLTGGFGKDSLSGGLGDDELLGGGGVGDNLNGEQGDDIVYGSDDGADTITGSDGRDRIFANGGNDTISGGPGDDIIDAGAGDDLVEGDTGSDLILGGAGHDTVFGHSASGTGDDNAVDYLYGDFGTNGSEPGAGRDRLSGQGGNDFLFGEGEDDLINDGANPGYLVNYGAGESANPADFVPPIPTPAPSVTPSTPPVAPAATLQNGPDYRGRWTEFSSSASGGGISVSDGLALEPAIVGTAEGIYVAWADGRSGNFEIYVAKHTPAGWQELGGSAHGGGISGTENESRRPAMTLDSAGNPVVAWTEFSSTGSDIRALRFDPAANRWVALGASAVGGGVSGTGAADAAQIVNTAAGLVLAWLDNSNGGITNAYLRRFNGVAWENLNSGTITSTGGAGVSRSTTSVADISLTSDGAKFALGWTQVVGANREIYLREFAGGVWSELAGSASSGGISGTPGASTAPSLAYFGGALFAAWQDLTSGSFEIFAKRFNGVTWTEAGSGTATGTGLSGTIGAATQPKLSGDATALHLVWLDDRLGNATGNIIDLYAKKWNGSAFVEELAGDASSSGIHSTSGAAPDSPALTVNGAGHPVVVWNDLGTGHPEVDARGNAVDLKRTFTAGPQTPVQTILDAQDLGAGDVILVEAGATLAGFSLAAGDGGVLIRSLPGVKFTSVVNINGGDDVTIQGGTLAGGLIVTQSNRFTLRESAVTGPVTINGGNAAHLHHNNVTGSSGIILAGGSVDGVIEHNTISVGGVALLFSDTGPRKVTVRDNRLTGTTALSVAVASDGSIEGNDLAGSGTGLEIKVAFTGVIRANDIHNGTVGLVYGAPAVLSRNRIHNNGTGVVSNVVEVSNAFGFVGTAEPNEIFANNVGVNLAGTIQNQHIYANTTGVTGSGVLGGDKFEFANVIEGNDVGVNFNGLIQFNRIVGNKTGMMAQASQLIAHNLFYRNTEFGLRVTGKSDVRIFNNTFYSSTGDNVRLDGITSNVQLVSNILWARGGFDLKVADDSRVGFFSDYNDLYSSDTGKLVHWLKDFTDVLDWQMDLGDYDQHSIGRTVVNPTWANPQFRSRTLGDLRPFDLVAGQRFSSPTIDGGSGFADQALPAVYKNLLANPSFEDGTANWTANNGGATSTANPVGFQGQKYFFAGAVDAGYAEQTVNLTTAGYTAAQLDAESLVLVFGGRVRTVDDRGQIVLTFINASNAAIGKSIVVPAANVSDRWELIGDRRQVPVGTRSVRLHFDTFRQAGGPNDTYLDGAFVNVLPEAFAPNQGAFGNTYVEDTEPKQPHVALRSPDLYVDWELARPHSIRWDSYQNIDNTPVRIDLYQDSPAGPALLLNITPSTSDNGEFIWTPQNSALKFGTAGLRIQVSHVSNNLTLDRSTENFTIPEDGQNYFIADAANTNDEYTPNATGNNRATGKLPTAPKPLLTALLRVYDFGANDKVMIDTGQYDHFKSVVISGNTILNDDEGVFITGPVDLSRVARIDPIGWKSGFLFDLNDADFVTLTHLTIGSATMSVWVHNLSVHFTGTYLTVSGNAQDGIRIEADAADPVLGHIDSSNNGREGISVAGPIADMSDNRAYNNKAVGIYLANSGAATIEGNEVFGNREGISIINSAQGAPLAVVGRLDLAAGRGNKVHNNAEMGIRATGNVLVAGNTVYGQTGDRHTGIALSGATASRNIVYDNYDGIVGGTTENNRVFHNSHVGLVMFNFTGLATGNVIYSNGTGVFASFDTNVGGPGPALLNNLIYANDAEAITLVGGLDSRIFNNTIYQSKGNAITISPASTGARNVRIRNNIFRVEAGSAISIVPEIQTALTSDYNLFLTTASGTVGTWGRAPRNKLSDWQQASFLDANSLTTDPLFVDIDGADGQLGYVNQADHGADDDFHERTPNGSYHGGSLTRIDHSLAENGERKVQLR